MTQPDGNERARAGELRLFGVPMGVERGVYATVALMSVLVVYDGWSSLTTFFGIAAVIIGPVLALAVAHWFADAMAWHFELQRTLRGSEWLAVAGRQLDVLLAGVPPLLICLVGWLTPMDARSTIAVIVWTGVATLIAFAVLGAVRAGVRGWRLILAGAVGGLIGLIVLGLQVVLKPH
ncbi:MAG: hypothetical protein R2737_02240 [Candidatus Nanopelagicales bacterium]